MDNETGEVIVGEDNQIIENPVVETPQTNEADEGNDERLTSTTNEEDNDDAAAEAEGAGKTDEEREAIRERRRLERQERKQRGKEKDERLRRELASEREQRLALEQRLAVLERRSTGSELAQIDGTIKQTQNAYNYHKEQIRIATESGDGSALADATEKMFQAQQRIQQLTNIKQQHQRQAQAPQPLDGRLVNHANDFMSKHTWFKQDGNDLDSSITRQIDNALAAEGWNPTTPEYWEELEERVKKYLPHRAKGAKVPQTDNRQSTPRSVVGGSGRDSAGSPAGKNTFTLSADRVKAMKDAGVWDNPTQRADAIKRFRDYDNQNKGK